MTTRNPSLHMTMAYGAPGWLDQNPGTEPASPFVPLVPPSLVPPPAAPDWDEIAARIARALGQQTEKRQLAIAVEHAGAGVIRLKVSSDGVVLAESEINGRSGVLTLTL